jgi:CBS domain-containing protein
MGVRMSNAEAMSRTPDAAQSLGRGRNGGRHAPAAGNGSARELQRSVATPFLRPRFARLQQRGVLDGSGYCAEHIEVRCPVCMYSSPVDPEDREAPRCAESAARANAVRLQPIAESGAAELAGEAPGAAAPRAADREALAEVFLQRGITSAPVVSADGRALGFVSMTDLVRDRHENGGGGAIDDPLPDWLVGEPGVRVDPGPRTVGEVMTTPAISVTAYTSVTRAAAVMAFEGIRQLAVSALDGRVIGVISAVDVLRWIAQRSGFAVPAAEAEPSSPRR